MDAAVTRASASPGNFGLAWILLCLAFCAHVADEALTGFLNVYNPTVIAMRDRLAWFPMPTFEYREWLVGLIVANLILLALTPFARWPICLPASCCSMDWVTRFSRFWGAP